MLGVDPLKRGAESGDGGFDKDISHLGQSNEPGGAFDQGTDSEGQRGNRRGNNHRPMLQVIIKQQTAPRRRLSFERVKQIWFDSSAARFLSGRQALDLGRQTALVPCGLILMDDLLVGDPIDDRYRLLVNTLRCRFIARDDRLLHTLDGGAQAGAQAGVVSALLDGLTGTLAGLSASGPKCKSL